MKVLYVARNFEPSQIVARYAAQMSSGYQIFEVNNRALTIRTFIVDRAELPSQIVDECDRLKDQTFNQVKMS